MIVNQPLFVDASVELLQSTGVSPAVYFKAGSLYIVHEYVAPFAQTGMLIDTLALGETLSPVAHYAASLIDAFSLSSLDAGAGHYSKANQDALALADIFSALVAYKSSLSDTVTLTDFAVGCRHIISTLADTLTLLDTHTGSAAHTGALLDVLAFSDTTTPVAHFKATIADTVSLNDAIAGTLTFSEICGKIQVTFTKRQPSIVFTLG